MSVSPVFHYDCWDSHISEIESRICDEICKYRELCGEDQDALDEHCDNCPVGHLVEAGL